MLLGGALTSAFNWSWIFFINVPAGMLVLALVPFLLRESRAELEHRHFDAAGAVSITGGLMLLVYAHDPRGAARLGHRRDDRPARGVRRAHRRRSS